MTSEALSPTQLRLLQRLYRGDALRDHRYLDGRTVYRLHPLEGAPQTVRRATVQALRRRGLIESNKKFPAATYVLTPTGRTLAAALT